MLPLLDALSGVLIRLAIYIIARLKAKPATKDLVATLQPAQTKLKGAMTVREAADTLAIEAGANLDDRYLDLCEQIGIFGVKAFGHFGSRTAEGYLEIFPKAPSILVKTPVLQRAAVFAKLRKAALAGPKELAAFAKELDATGAAWDKAVLDDAAAQEALAVAVKAEKKAADEWQTAVRVLKAQLAQRFPRNPEKVASFFPPTPKKAAVVALEPVVAPVAEPKAEATVEAKPE